MRALSLFSGIGGFDLAAEWAGIEIVGMVENDSFCQKVLKKHWPNVKLLGDIHDVKGNEFGKVDIIYGGPPCQPASCAGKRGGKKDSRWLWGETYRIIRTTKPQWIVLENVRGILSLEGGMVFENLLLELESYGYETRAFCLPACAVNAPHRRDRAWVIAYLSSERKESISQQRQRGGFKPENRNASDPLLGGNGGRGDGDTPGLRRPLQTARPDRDASDAEGDNFRPGLCEENQAGERRGRPSDLWGASWPEVAARLCRVAYGVPSRVDRLKALGNAIVPQVAYQILKAIAKIELDREERAMRRGYDDNLR